MRDRWLCGCLSAGVLACVIAAPVLVQAQAAPGGRGAAAGQASDDDDARPAGRGGRGAKPTTPPPPTPRWPDGRVNLGPAPGGKGFWNNASGQPFGRTSNTSLPTNPLLEDIPFRPWAKALYEFRRFRNGLDDPHARCQPPGGMRFFTVPNGMEFIDQPELKRIFLLAGENREWRRVAMEPGRKHPAEDELNPSYFGDSIGWWEGDTLVIDTVGFSEKFWMIRGGLPHTKFLHLTERITRVNFNELKYEVTVDDKGAYTKPWSGGWIVPWMSTSYDGSDGGEIHEYFCIDNERDSENLERH